METRHLHRWDVGYADARGLQAHLAGQVLVRDEVGEPSLIAGIDAFYDRPARQGTAAVAIVTYPDLALVEVRTYRAEVSFPYIPGLLSFRECPLVLGALERLETDPGLFLVDGQGYAHPRRFGLACHLGLLLDRPTIGCAKSRLCGEHGVVGEERGAYTELVDGDHVIGAVVRTRRGARPVYVSVGHRVDLSASVRWVVACGAGYRIPEPLRLAHLAASGKLREGLSRPAAPVSAG